MWIRWSEVLAPLTRLTSSNIKFEWTYIEQTAFDKIKQIVGHETLLSYPDFNKPFEIHTDTSHTQLGVVISQNNKPIAFYSRKLQLAQTQYTTTEHELLSIVKTLKEFKNILFGQQIMVYTDHKNLTYKNFNTEHFMWWWLLIEEFGPIIEYIKGPKNIVPDALSGLNLISSPSNVQDVADCYGLNKDDLPSNAFPITYQLINRKQNNDKTLLATIKNGAKNYLLKEFHGGGRSSQLLCYKNRIVIPQGLQKRVVQWYHHTLCHPEINQTKETISQHFYWKTWEIILHVMCLHEVCVKNKRSSAKSMDYSWKRKLNINHGNGYVLISLVLIKYKQRNVVTKYQN